MTKSGHAKLTSFRQEAEQTAKDERAIQSKVDRSDKAAGKQEKKGGAMQAGARVYPEPPLPKQHLKKPGHEADLELAPMYDAPHYKGSEKLLDKVALITGADSGIGRAVAVLFAREGADVAVAYLDEHWDAKETKRAVEAEGRRCILLWRTPNSARMPSGGRSTSSGDSIFSSTTRRSRSTSTASRS